ncbi:hypothetical protein RvY_07431-3 [Ramazzottius varieornatus]|nr:hypothetical protein RvY_07431-3 [Ramazzottius varieornatus]
MGNQPSQPAKSPPAPPQPSLPLSQYQRRVLELEQRKADRDRLLEQYRLEVKSGVIGKKKKKSHKSTGNKQEILPIAQALDLPQPEERNIVTYATGGGVRGLVNANRMPTPDTGG